MRVNHLPGFRPARRPTSTPRCRQGRRTGSVLRHAALADPAELACAMLPLASNEASYMTAATFMVDRRLPV